MTIGTTVEWTKNYSEKLNVYRTFGHLYLQNPLNLERAEILFSELS